MMNKALLAAFVMILSGYVATAQISTPDQAPLYDPYMGEWAHMGKDSTFRIFLENKGRYNGQLKSFINLYKGYYTYTKNGSAKSDAGATHDTTITMGVFLNRNRRDTMLLFITDTATKQRGRVLFLISPNAKTARWELQRRERRLLNLPGEQLPIQTYSLPSRMVFKKVD